VDKRLKDIAEGLKQFAEPKEKEKKEA
jgi:hypothetical protein